MVWILSLLKAIPGLSRLIAKLEKSMRYAKTEKRREDKHSRIDARIDAARRGVRDSEIK
jgi:hypothetical protein